jgi:hypothetical protein
MELAHTPLSSSTTVFTDDITTDAPSPLSPVVLIDAFDWFGDEPLARYEMIAVFGGASSPLEYSESVAHALSGN